MHRAGSFVVVTTGWRREGEHFSFAAVLPATSELARAMHHSHVVAVDSALVPRRRRRRSSRVTDGSLRKRLSHVFSDHRGNFFLKLLWNCLEKIKLTLLAINTTYSTTPYYGDLIEEQDREIQFETVTPPPSAMGLRKTGESVDPEFFFKARMLTHIIRITSKI